MIFGLRLISRFSQYHYFRQIADFLKIKVPPLNQQILMSQDKKCTVHGLKIIQKIQDTAQQTTTQNPSTQQSTQNSSPQPQQPDAYTFDKKSEISIPFGQAYAAAKHLSMDLCLIKEQSNGRNPVLSLSTARKHIYEEYYKLHIKKKGKQAFKSVRLGQKINENDFRNKYQNVKRMHAEGHRYFKLIGLNDSEKSQKIIIEFAKLFGKSIEPTLKTFKTGFKKAEEQRWVGSLLFEEPIQVYPGQVNKKWRRLKFETQKIQKEQQEKVEQFQHEDPQIEKDLYEAYKEMDKKLPERFRELAEIEKDLQSDRMALFKSAAETSDTPEFEWDEEQQIKFQEMMNSHNDEYLQRRTIDQILTEMQALKNSGYQSEAYKVARFRVLKSELEARIRGQENRDL